MLNRLIDVSIAFVAAIVLLSSLPITSVAQTRERDAATPAPETPRLAGGGVNLGRVPGEKGVWDLPYTQNMAAVAVGRPAPPAGAGRNGAAAPAEPPVRGSKAEPWIPFMPWSAALYDYNVNSNVKYDPEGYCLPPGGPRMFATPYPAEIIQLPEQERIIIIFEGGAHIWREIYMDGRAHPAGDALNPTYLGHSVGHWEGDTLVVDTVGFNEGTWIDFAGHVHTDMLHVIERFTRPNKNTLHYEATIDDPGAYTRPWTTAWDIRWDPVGELREYICQENNKYLKSLTDDFGEPIF